MSDDVQIETRLMAIDDELAVLRTAFEKVREEVRALAEAVRASAPIEPEA